MFIADHPGMTTIFGSWISGDRMEIKLYKVTLQGDRYENPMELSAPSACSGWLGLKLIKRVGGNGDPR